MSPFKGAAHYMGVVGSGRGGVGGWRLVASVVSRNFLYKSRECWCSPSTGLLFLGGLSWTPLQNLENKHLPPCMPHPHIPPHIPADDLWGQGGSATRQGFLV